MSDYFVGGERDAREERGQLIPKGDISLVRDETLAWPVGRRFTELSLDLQILPTRGGIPRITIRCAEPKRCRLKIPEKPSERDW